MKPLACCFAIWTALLFTPGTSVMAQESSVTGSTATAGTPWIHVQVVEEGVDGEKVSINLPLSLIQVAIDVAPEDALSQAQVQLEQNSLSVSDLRRLWNELRDAGQEEFVTVESNEERVRVLRRGDDIVVDVEEAAPEGKEGKTVHIEVPVSVVDALLSGEGEELNLEQMVSRLQEQRGEIVRVNEGESQIRIWIDEK